MSYYNKTKQPCLQYKQDIDNKVREEYIFTRVKEVCVSRTSNRQKTIIQTEKIRGYSGQNVEELLITLIKYEEKCKDYDYTKQDQWGELPKVFQDTGWTAWKEFWETIGMRRRNNYRENRANYWEATGGFIIYIIKDGSKSENSVFKGGKIEISYFCCPARLFLARSLSFKYIITVVTVTLIYHFDPLHPFSPLVIFTNQSVVQCSTYPVQF